MGRMMPRGERGGALRRGHGGSGVGNMGRTPCLLRTPSYPLPPKASLPTPVLLQSPGKRGCGVFFLFSHLSNPPFLSPALCPRKLTSTAFPTLRFPGRIIQRVAGGRGGGRELGYVCLALPRSHSWQQNLSLGASGWLAPLYTESLY